jgi:arylsulfatase A
LHFPDLPLIEGEKAVALNPDQSQLTTNYTERAVRFIRKNKHRPFFLYVAHNMPHVPLFVSAKFKGKSQRGLYGDVIMEIDWSVGQINGGSQEGGLDDRTMVIFTSDNGPWLSYGNHGGSAGDLREGKATTFEGGIREPCLMRWPGRIAPGTVCRQPAATIDIFPTFARLAGVKLPEHKIDGLDMWPVISGVLGATSPHEAYYFYGMNSLQAVRAGKWKLHFPHTYSTLAGKPPGKEGEPGPYSTRKIGLSLYDLEGDPGETHDVTLEHADIVKRMIELAEKARDDLGDAASKRIGKGVRPPGHI